MKKVLSIFGALLLTLAVNAQLSTTVTKTYAPSKLANHKLKVEAPTQMSRIATDLGASNLRRMPQQTTASSTISISDFNQVGYDEVEFHFTGSPILNNTTYYQIAIYDEDLIPVAWNGWEVATFDTIAKQVGLTDAYYFSTFLLLNYGLQEEGWANSVDSTYYSSYKQYYYHLKEGAYFVEIKGLDSKYNTTEDANDEMFEVINYQISNLKVELNTEKTKATITWKNPTNKLAKDWIYVNVSSGATEVFDNYPEKEDSPIVTATSPLVVDVKEGRPYSVTACVMGIYNYRNGDVTTTSFTVGENKTIPTDLKTEIIEGDSVIFTWSAKEPAPLYYFTIYEDGEDALYAVTDKLKIAGRIYAGTYTWSVQAIEADDQYYYPISDEIFGEEFTTKDVLAPVIKSAEQLLATTTTVTLKIDAEDNYTSFANIAYTVTNGEKTMVTDAKLTADSLLTLGGMELGKSYDIEIVAKDTLGNVSEPTKLTIKTSDDTEAPVLTVLTLKETTENSATINVSATDNKTATDNMFYSVSFKDSQKFLDNLRATTGTITLTGLEPLTEYTIVVRAKDEGSNLSEPKELTFKTKEPAPVEMAITEMEARYFESQSTSERFYWTISFYTEKKTPFVLFSIYADKPAAIAGNYSLATSTVDISFTFYSANGQSVNNVAATDAELNLEFQKYDESEGHRFGIYNGTFKVKCADGVTYIGKVNKLKCPAYDNDHSTPVKPVTITMRELGEPEEDALEEVQVQGLDLSKPMYNVLGQQVGTSYRGIILQNGKKFMIK